MKLLTWLGTMLFPDKCILCGKLLEDGELDLCTGCRVQAPECPVSKIKFPFIDQWTALWYYKDHVRKSLLKYKFQNCRSNAAGYGRLLAMKLMKEDRLDFDVLTWIPISRLRKFRRGYDQVELLARSLGKELGVRPVPVLKKIRHNRQQSRISGDAHRIANVLGAYEAVNLSAIAGRRILLLDDIITTGATAGECAKVLQTAGAAQVSFAAIAAANKKRTDRGNL
jgi:ComF family protein